MMTTVKKITLAPGHLRQIELSLEKINEIADKIIRYKDDYKVSNNGYSIVGETRKIRMLLQERLNSE